MSAFLNLKENSFDYLRGEIISDYETEDGVRIWGSNISVIENDISQTRGTKNAHCDLIQIIPQGKEPNAQMFGAITENINITDNVLYSNGMDQGIFCSDGLISNCKIIANTIDTQSQHFITLPLLNGEIYNNTNLQGNNIPIVINPLRIGGGHPKSFYVGSFINEKYEFIKTNQSSLIDKRFNEYDNMVYDFDLNKWRRISEKVPYGHGEFNQHFETCLRYYFKQPEMRYKDIYYSPNMKVTESYISVSDRRLLSQEDINYWFGQWRYFKPYEVDSRDFSIYLHKETFTRLNNLRKEYGKPLYINSAWRTLLHNKAVGGKKNSDHTKVRGRRLNATAYDIAISNIGMGRRLERLAIKHGFNAIGRYPKSRFIHISRRKPKRNGKIYSWGNWNR